MWERFSFYLMIGLLPQYLLASPTKGGRGMSLEEVATILGTYTALVYFTPFIGGIIADRLTGYRKAVVIGAIVMCAGQVSLAFGMLYLGLGLLIVGNGLFKPTISTMLGRLYPVGSNLKDAGFNNFYFGINVGGFACNFVAAIVRNKYGWGWAFASAAIGLAIGLVTFLLIYKRLGRAEIIVNKEGKKADNSDIRPLWNKVLPATIAFGVIGYLLGGIDGAFYAGCTPVVIFYIRLWTKAVPEEKGQIGALLTLTALLVPFWMVFNLNNTVFSSWAKDNTNREVPDSTISVLKEVNLLEDAPVDYFFNADPDRPRPDKTWLKVTAGTEEEVEAIKKTYAKLLDETSYLEAGPIPVTQEEFDKVYEKSNGQTLKPGEALPAANPELFQSINPGFVMLLTPLFALIWGMLRMRKKEPSTMNKMSLGMIFASVCWIVMLLAVYNTNNGTDKASAIWLIGATLWITMGELCLSPIGLSLVNKMAPARLGAMMMGGWFLSSAIGNKISGTVGGPLWANVPRNYFFIGLMILMLIFAFIIWKVTPQLEKFMPKQDDTPEAVKEASAAT
jgi:POT family proton-dependent oligopeptide transporter